MERAARSLSVAIGTATLSVSPHLSSWLPSPPYAPYAPQRNAFRGLSLNLVQLFMRQILEALAVLRDVAIIHCDLKVRGEG